MERNLFITLMSLQMVTHVVCDINFVIMFECVAAIVPSILHAVILLF